MYKSEGRVYLIPLFTFMLLAFIYVPNNFAGTPSPTFGCGEAFCLESESNCISEGCIGRGGACEWCPDNVPGDQCISVTSTCESAPGPVEAVPTLGEWGMIFTAIILGFLAVYMMLRRKNSSV